MFKIADFSRLTRVTVKMLRHYDDLGLLRPQRVDPQTGYRYYAAEQLPRLNRLIALKDLGFSLEQVRALLDDGLPAEELRGMLRLRRAELEAEIAAAEERLRRVEARLSQIAHEAGQPRYEVVLRAVPPQLVAAIYANVPEQGGAISALFDEAEAFAAAGRARAIGCPLTIFHDADYREGETALEVAVPLAAPLPPAGRVRVYELPHLTAACVVYTGGYERTAEATQAIMIWAAASGYRVAGPLREVYLRFRADCADSLGLPLAYLTDRSALFVTEVQIPVELDEEGAKR